jgi:hypothetical protein
MSPVDEQQEIVEHKIERWHQRMKGVRYLAKNQFPLLVEQLLVSLLSFPAQLLTIVDSYVTRRYLLVGGDYRERISFMDDYEHASFSDFTIDPKWKGREICTLFVEQNSVIGFGGSEFSFGKTFVDTFRIDLIQRRLDVVTDWKVDVLHQFHKFHAALTPGYKPVRPLAAVLLTNKDWMIMDWSEIALMQNTDQKMQVIPKTFVEESHYPGARIVYYRGAYYSICRDNRSWKLRKQISNTPLTSTKIIYFDLPLPRTLLDVLRLFLWKDELWVFIDSELNHALINLTPLVLGTLEANEDLPTLDPQFRPESHYSVLENDISQNAPTYPYSLVWIDSETSALYFARRSFNDIPWPIYTITHGSLKVQELDPDDSAVVGSAIRFHHHLYDFPLNGVHVPHHLWFPFPGKKKPEEEEEEEEYPR